MSETRLVKVLQPDATVAPCEVRVTKTMPARLIFSGLGMRDLEFEGSDLFEALRVLRTDLEQRGCRVLCAGARVDVFPSGMSRDMSGGAKAYVMQIGVPATKVIDILDEAPPDLVGTVSEQVEFHNKWILSLKG